MSSECAKLVALKECRMLRKLCNPGKTQFGGRAYAVAEKVAAMARRLTQLEFHERRVTCAGCRTDTPSIHRSKSIFAARGPARRQALDVFLLIGRQAFARRRKEAAEESGLACRKQRATAVPALNTSWEETQPPSTFTTRPGLLNRTSNSGECVVCLGTDEPNGTHDNH